MTGWLVPLDLIHRGVGGRQCVLLHAKHTHTRIHQLCKWISAQGHFVEDDAVVVDGHGCCHVSIWWRKNGHVWAKDGAQYDIKHTLS